MLTDGQVTTSPVSAEVERACTHFLFLEAELLDKNDYTGWFERCISADVAYVIPTRTTRERGMPEFSEASFHVKDSYAGIHLRVQRMLTEYAWAEDPPSRTRRYVTNIRVSGLAPDQVEVRSNLLVHRSQWDTPHYDLISAGREDVLRFEGDTWRLLRRVVLLNHTILPTANLGIFL